MWIGSDAGLFRYDGHNYKEYKCDNRNAVSISNIQIDQLGNIWCQNFAGQIFIVNDQKDQLDEIIDVSRFSSKFPTYTVDGKGNVWIALDKSIMIVNNKGKVLNRNLFSHLLKKWDKWADLKFNGKYIYAVNFFKDVYVFDNEQRLKYTYHFNNKLESRNFFCVSGNKTVLICEHYNPSKKYDFYTFINGKTINIQSYQPKNQNETIYQVIPNGNSIFYCSSNGVYEVTKQAKPKIKRHFLHNEKVSSFFRDKEGNNWFSTLQNGIFVSPNLSVAIYNSSYDNLIDNNITYVAHINGKITVGDYNGAVRCLNHFKQKFETEITAFADSRSVKKIMEYKGKIYVAHGRFTICSKKQTQEIKSLRNIRDFQIVQDTLYYVSVDEAGYLPLNNTKAKTIIRNKGGKKICLLPNGKIYCLFTDGLFFGNKDELKMVQFHNKKLVGNDIQILQQACYLATLNLGLVEIINGIPVKIIPVLKHQNQPEIQTFTADKTSFYLVSNQGLTIINQKSLKSRTMNIYDGFFIQEASNIIVFNKNVWISSTKGLVAIPYNHSFINKISPQVQITGLFTNGKKISADKAIDLSHDFGVLEINFNAKSFRSRGSFKYAYRLLPRDKKWYYLNGENTSMVLSQLAPGKYTFEIKGVNEDNITSKSIAHLSFNVSPPIYQRWWFLLLIISLICLLIWIYFANRIKQMHHKSNLQNKLIKSQLTALKSQMNPHFMFNALNSIQSLMLQKDTKNSNLYLSRFSSLLRQVLKASDKEMNTISEEINILKLYLELEKLRFDGELEYVIQADPELEDLQIPTLILQPYVENALKHGLLHKDGGKKLIISFTFEEYLTCIVEDNGIGRVRASELKSRRTHESFALSAIETRINLLSQYYKDNFTVEILDLYENGNALGTKVILKFPKS